MEKKKEDISKYIVCLITKEYGAYSINIIYLGKQLVYFGRISNRRRRSHLVKTYAIPMEKIINYPVRMVNESLRHFLLSKIINDHNNNYYNSYYALLASNWYLALITTHNDNSLVQIFFS